MVSNAHLSSEWLKQHIRERGGSLKITSQIVISG